MAFSEGNWILFRMIHINCATEISLGTKNLRLSMSWICELGAFSTTTCMVESVKDFIEFNCERVAHLIM